jgi:type II secretory pathway component PulL
MTRYHSINGERVAFTAEEEVARNAEEAAWAAGQADRDLEELREKRNTLLAETDWWASSDLTITDAQTAYRQALRDITDTHSSLDDVVWPEKP